MVSKAKPFLLNVQVIKNSPELNAKGIFKGMVGTISNPSVDEHGWIVHFKNKITKGEIVVSIEAEFLKVLD